MFKLLLVLSVFYIAHSHPFTNVYPKFKKQQIDGDPGTPLFLTPLIQAGKIKQARILSEVQHWQLTKTKSHAGYLTVDKQFDSNTFFWYFPAVSANPSAPVLVWLQGGPGASSLFGLFGENGPFVVKKKRIELRKYSWTKNHSVVYIDNPVGTGYSFTNGGYAQNETAIGKALYNALLQFFQLFPKISSNDLYITGESYAGKYVPAVSYAIYKNNPSAKQKINLKGLAIGNGYSDPLNQWNYGDYLYQLGLLDENEKEQFKKKEQAGIDFIKQKQWRKAYETFNNLLDGDQTNNSLFKNTTGFQNYYNFLISSGPPSALDFMGAFIQRSDVRAAIHVGNVSFNNVALDVGKYLEEDISQSVAPWIEELLNNYRVLVYNGQLDIIVAYPLTVNYLQNLNFSSALEYKTAPRHKWHVGDELAGYIKQAGNLTEVLVRNAGHMVPADQPRWALDLITRFTRNNLL